VRGLTDDVLTLVRGHAKETGRRVAQEALALKLLAQDDLKELLKVWSEMKEEHKKRKRKGETVQTLQCCRFD
jgi:chorismate synthase